MYFAKETTVVIVLWHNIVMVSLNKSLEPIHHRHRDCRESAYRFLTNFNPSDRQIILLSQGVPSLTRSRRRTKKEEMLTLVQNGSTAGSRTTFYDLSPAIRANGVAL